MFYDGEVRWRPATRPPFSWARMAVRWTRDAVLNANPITLVIGTVVAIVVMLLVLSPKV